MRGIIVATVVVFVGGCPAAGGAGHRANPDCVSNYPQGIPPGTYKTYFGLVLDPQDGMHYQNPASFTEELRREFVQVLERYEAGQPAGPQFNLVEAGQVSWRDGIWVNVTIKSSGTDPAASDQAWANVKVDGLNIGDGPLFWSDGPAFTRADAEVPEMAAVDEAAGHFYNHMTGGWTCN
jgi:hypothetical protein